MNQPSARTRRSPRRHSPQPPRGSVPLAPFAGLFHRMIDRIDAGLVAGSLEVDLPDGTRRLLGARADGPAAVVEMANWRALIRLATGGSGGWYVAWDRGEWSSPDPVKLFELFSRNRVSLGETGRATGVGRVLRRILHAMRRNTRIGARRNIAQHYDLGNDFYALWLDPTMCYSSALFDLPGQSLEEGQRAKLRAILARSGAKAGDRLLEIGCGWGGFAEMAAEAGVSVHAITLSAEQRSAVAERTSARSLPVDVTLTDYRDVAGCYDAVASIEMVEAVGQDYWQEYLAVIARVLKPGGRAAIQYIAIDDAIFESYARNVDFVQERVFPGGMLLSVSRFRQLAERVGLTWRDQHDFPLDYAETLREWRARFDQAVEDGRLPPRFDRRFVDLWRYYLMYCEGGFRGGGLSVAQVTLLKL